MRLVGGKGSELVAVKPVQSISLSHICPWVRPWVAHSKDQQAGTRVALALTLEHGAPAALPPASGGLQEVTPKMPTHKYHLNLITWNNGLVLDGGSGGHPKAWLRAPENPSCLLFSASLRPAIVAAVGTSGFPCVFVRGKEVLRRIRGRQKITTLIVIL